ncbi:MAG: GtrA family protein [Candidatus Pacebacteria bacterium]|nr:GtrA family protein [Candidatus Paceibacterota bacterium]
MKKNDVLSPLVIGEVCALIFLGISRFLELPETILKISKLFPVILPILSLAGVYIASILGEKSKTLFQFAKSGLSGVLNTFIDLGVLNLLMWGFNIASGMPFSIFKSISFGVATVNSYFWAKYWVFEKTETKPSIKEFFQFSSVAVGGFLIHIIISGLIVNIIGPKFGIEEKLWANIGAIVAICIGFSWTFFGYKMIVFKK